MDIIRTCAALKTASASYTIAQTGFTRKTDGGLHSGHAACITACKTLAQKTVISFFPLEETYNHVFGTAFAIPAFDESYCTSFCESYGADIVFIPTFAHILSTYFQGIVILNLNTIINNQIIIKGYSGYDGKYLEAAIALEYLRIQKKLYPKHATAYSIKEGYKSFARKNYYETELGIPCTLVGLTYRPDGLPESSSYNNNSLTPEEIDILVNIYNVINNKTFAELDALEDFTDLTNQLNTFDQKPVQTIYVYYIRKWTEGIIGLNKILLEVAMFVGPHPEVELLVVVKENI